jgi:hypothetical protein
MEDYMKKTNPKTALTPEEKIRVAAAYEVFNIDQHVLAFLYGVNQGRINEAIMDLKQAAGYDLGEKP